MPSTGNSWPPRDTRVLTMNISAKQLPAPVVAAARDALDRLLGLRRFNALYGAIPPCDPADFWGAFLEALQIRIDLAGRPVDAIPSAGPLIVVANHPFGMIEGMVLHVLLLARQHKISMMLTHLLATI